MIFDYEKYEEYCCTTENRVSKFINGEYFPVFSRTQGDAFGKCCRYKEDSFSTQMNGIMRTIETDNDWIPYLEAWHGVGVYAQAYGCEYIWSDTGAAPQTKPVVCSMDELRALKHPTISNAEMLQCVLNTTEYFVEQTNGRIPISSIDSMSPIGTLSLIADTTFLFENAWDYPEDFHRVLQSITDLMIEFTLKQRSLCPKIASPGNCLWSPPFFQGSITLSGDLMVMFGNDFYEEFVRPYDERIARTVGGIAIHSCGRFKRHFDSILATQGLRMLDLALSKNWDPTPNDVDEVLEAFSGKDLPIHARVNYDDSAVIDKLLTSDIPLALQLSWQDDPDVRRRQYRDIKSRREAIKHKTV